MDCSMVRYTKRRVISAQGLVGRHSSPPNELRQVAPETMATRHHTTNMSIRSQHLSLVETMPLDTWPPKAASGHCQKTFR
jgi:hypothetical protein